MGARTGQEYLDRLVDAARRRSRSHGETLSGGIPDHPAFRNVVAHVRARCTTCSTSPSCATS